MRRAFLTLASFPLLCATVFAQNAKPRFEAADVHVSAPGANQSGGYLPGGRVEFRATTLLGLISFAYGVRSDAIAGGPPWIDVDRFDVIAKGTGSASAIALRNMLQNLLVERFGLSIQTEEKPQPVFALVMGKRGPPKESAKEGEPVWLRGNEDNTITMTCRNMSMAALAENLPAFAPAYFNHPVIDRTDLKGEYDFKLQWVGRGQLPAGPAGLKSSLSIFSSIEKQLGVVVEAQTATLPVLTVAHANRTPTENPPGVTEKLGPPPTQFDVAEIRPSRPGENEDFKMDNGRIEANAIALKDLIEFAYQVDDEELKGTQKWMDTATFDIVAKTAPTASPDTLSLMLRSLLAERFGLKVHKDVQPVTVYALTAVKPKLRDADPAGRSACTMNTAEGGRRYTCTNVTMAQVAEKLPGVAKGYIDHKIVDLTGLKGNYDFYATWSPRGRTLGSVGKQPVVAGDGAAGVVTPSTDPTAELTVFEAFERQLGLKLALRKHPMPVVVIDHVERQPTEN